MDKKYFGLDIVLNSEKLQLQNERPYNYENMYGMFAHRDNTVRLNAEVLSPTSLTEIERQSFIDAFNICLGRLESEMYYQLQKNRENKEV